MRTPEEPKETASTPKAAESKAPTTAAEQPAARPGPKKSLWAFLNGDIPSE